MKRNELANKTKENLKKWDAKKTVHENAISLGFKGDAQAYTFARFFGLSYTKKVSNIRKAISSVDTKNMTITEIANKTGFDYVRVSTFLRSHNLPYIKHLKAIVNRCNKKEVIEFLRKKGFNYTDIGRLFRITRQAVEQYHKDY